MAIKQQDLPHYGVKNGFTRKGKVICTAKESKRKMQDDEGKETEVVVPAQFMDFPSISRAKHYMRTGEAK